MTGIRLIATDLDGTLLRDDGSISERTRLALARAHEAGIVVVLASARSPRTVRVLAAAAGVTGLAICGNGAIIYDLAAETIVHHQPLTAVDAQAIVQAVRTAAPGAVFSMEQGLEYVCEPGYLALRGGTGDVPVRCDEAVALCTCPVTKICVRHPTMAVEELLHVAGEAVSRHATVTHSGGHFVEIGAAGVHKAGALARLCDQLGIAAAEVMAFGDMPNDLELLEWAGCGVAVANAHPAVLARADLVTRSNAEDGVALVVERVLAARAAHVTTSADEARRARHH